MGYKPWTERHPQDDMESRIEGTSITLDQLLELEKVRAKNVIPSDTLLPKGVCLECGSTFVKTKSWKKFCSELCHDRNWDKYHRKRKKKTKEITRIK